ncbi:hypothetical protein ZIOFF_046916 [Zingiber officinale]|uniref:ubiquitinyl hydrolase 1 n=1 Tax=Zingiber officinale TaxID=94328 RepID=A0A8J5FS66_ZINOF|nr:hypothetical protein ZIOFF_046916 [Zingiber officinale]
MLSNLNNLMQEKDSFRRSELDAIAEKLLAEDPFKGQWTPLSLIFKPHHNVFTGNYDINVLIAALESRRKTVVGMTVGTKPLKSINLAEESFMGLMLNVPVRRYARLGIASIGYHCEALIKYRTT